MHSPALGNGPGVFSDLHLFPTRMSPVDAFGPSLGSIYVSSMHVFYSLASLGSLGGLQFCHKDGLHIAIAMGIPLPHGW